MTDMTWAIASIAANTAEWASAIMHMARSVRFVPDTKYWRRRIEWRKRMANRRKRALACVRAPRRGR